MGNPSFLPENVFGGVANEREKLESIFKGQTNLKTTKLDI
jgi:hypothetical protein